MALLPWLFLLLVAQSGVPPAVPASPAQEIARHVKVSLSIRAGKTTFRSGEPIRLIASFTADQPGFQVDTVIDRDAQLEEQIEVTPEDGVFRWKELLSTPDVHGRDMGSSRNLSAQPVLMTLPLNYWFRFDKAGDYTVRVRTRRVRHGSPATWTERAPWLTSNEVTFKVVMMSEQEEVVEAQRLGALLDATPDKDSALVRERCEDLAFLTGDPGTAEKVRRALQPRGQYLGQWSGDLSVGFYISRNTPLVIGLLEADMRNPTKAAGNIFMLVNLRIWMELPALVAEARGDMDALRVKKRARRDALRAEYIAEAIASLPQRTDAARRETAFTLISMLRWNHDGTPLSAPLPDAVRKILIDQFTEFDPMSQGHLVQAHWKDIRDPKLLPALEQMLTSPDIWVRGQPLAAILDLAPERAKPMIIAEMLAPRPAGSPALVQLSDATLPELDGPLLDQITRLSASPSSGTQYLLKQKTQYLARYGSAAIVTDILLLYETRGSQLEQETRVNLAAYLDRWDESGSAERLRRALAAEKDAYGWISKLANARYTKALDAELRDRLDSADPRIVESAASLLSQYGPADARTALEARLTRWMNEWKPQTPERDPASTRIDPQVLLQVQLIRAIVGGKAWKVSEVDAGRLKQSCQTDVCRAAFAAR